jgi:hypothetical protein
MAKSDQAVETAAALEVANFFELSHARSTITYTPSNIAGKPLLTYNDGRTARTFTGDEVRIQKSELGNLVSVTLEMGIEGPAHLLTLVLPEVRVLHNSPVSFCAPVIFHTTENVITGRFTPGPTQTYDVKIFCGDASIVLT